MGNFDLKNMISRNEKQSFELKNAIHLLLLLNYRLHTAETK